MRKGRLVFLAALSRFAVGGLALALLALLGAETRRGAWVLFGYLAYAAIEQVLIRIDVGGRVRSLLAGLVDGAVITFFVHRLGSTAGAMSSVYVLAAVLNTLVVGRRVAYALAGAYSLMFNAVVWLEYAGKLPYAPDIPELAAIGRPPYHSCIFASFMIVMTLVASVSVVGALVRALDRRERDLTSANSRLEELSQRDPLTGLANRRHVFDALERLLESGELLCVVMLDLDGFKRINDTQGHLRGDLLLVEIAEAMRSATRERDVVGRYGGDEFFLVLPKADADAAEAVARRVTDAVADVGRKFDPAHPVTASTGIAVARERDSVASIARRADEACYRAKTNGGNRVVAA
jgi:diguanylate cyclase (GGDEF)-like protein